jgi:hypothetical protein
MAEIGGHETTDLGCDLTARGADAAAGLERGVVVYNLQSRYGCFRWGLVAFSSLGVFLLLTWTAGVTLADREQDANPLARAFEGDGEIAPRGKVDRLVFGELRRHGIKPARLCSDPVFLRRVYLDTIGTLPTVEEARRFLTSRSATKRRALIDELLERDEFAEYWAMKWSDTLRVKAEFPIKLWPNAVQAYHRWIKTSIKENLPYDEFVRELLTASGSNFRRPAVNFYRSAGGREPEALATAVALNFMGTRTKNWDEDRLAGMAAFFSQVGYKRTLEWKEEIVYYDYSQPTPEKAFFPDGTPATLAAGVDPRLAFADWLIQPSNPWFGRCLVNRLWFWLMGRGVIHEPDDIREDNPPSNPQLLDYLAQELHSADYDLREVFRIILNSKAYQLSSIPRTDDPDAEVYFAYYAVRRLEAEVLLDALCQLTGTREEYSSPIPEPFTFIPDHQRTIALADGSITSPFLEMFGRPPRDTGLATERNNQPSARQRLHLLNSTHVQRKIQQSSKLKKLIAQGRNPQEKITLLYLHILSRFPTDGEMRRVQKYASSGKVTEHEALVDCAWALINSMEFSFRH